VTSVEGRAGSEQAGPGDAAPARDRQTVTAEGQPVRPQIAGVVVKLLRPIEDERGDVCEMFNPAWGVSEAPLVYVYQIRIRPGKIKGWVVHYEQEDRLFVSRGAVRFALYDHRADSPTRGLLNVFVQSDRNAALVVIPRGVYHALHNVGDAEATLINMPTALYNHANPDKYRLPLKNDLIPFSFAETAGW